MRGKPLRIGTTKSWLGAPGSQTDIAHHTHAPMDTEHCPVLETAVHHYDSTGQAVTPSAIAGTVTLSEREIAERLAKLADCELLAHTGEGYRPTITGREFLALDVDCGPIIVDTENCE